MGKLDRHATERLNLTLTLTLTLIPCLSDAVNSLYSLTPTLSRISPMHRLTLVSLRGVVSTKERSLRLMEREHRLLVKVAEGRESQERLWRGTRAVRRLSEFTVGNLGQSYNVSERQSTNPKPQVTHAVMFG